VLGICAHKWGLRAPTAKLVNVQQVYVQICHTGFHPDRTVVVQSADGN
jgi:hypothetical protein